jgi:hypothetical protein
MTVSLTTLPLPQDLALAASASALNDAGYWASLYDASWRLVFVTDELRLTFGDIGTSSSWPIGHHYFSVEMVRFRETRLQGAWASPNFRRKNFL